MDLLLRIVGIITPVLVVSAFGYGYGRLRQPDMTWINRLLTDLLFPSLIFSAMASKDFHILEYTPLLLGSVAMILGSGGIAWLVARWLNYNPHAFVPSMMFSNVANMGLPLTLFAFGPDLLPAAVSMFMIFSLIHFTIGIRLCAPNADTKGILRSPMLWAMILGILMSLGGFILPAWLSSSLRLLGDAAIPLGLFALGVGFSTFRITNWSAGLVGAILCPVSGLLVAWPLVHFLPLTPAMRGLLILYAALPPAVTNHIFAERYHQDPGLVSAIVVGGNIASLFFIPVALSFAL